MNQQKIGQFLKECASRYMSKAKAYKVRLLKKLRGLK